MKMQSAIASVNIVKSQNISTIALLHEKQQSNAESSKSINVTSIHLHLHSLITSELLAAHETEAQKSHAEALAAANMLDQIEKDLDDMKTKNISKTLILEVIIKTLVKN
ncbi:hypothetical protein PABG_11985 [Paracoccidioides brasiliensis Pb03]|nr:hypothetical protein PABG_11985 [Paracoccidioides brasiliensis Pb03]